MQCFISSNCLISSNRIKVGSCIINRACNWNKMVITWIQELWMETRILCRPTRSRKTTPLSIHSLKIPPPLMALTSSIPVLPNKASKICKLSLITGSLSLKWIFHRIHKITSTIIKAIEQSKFRTIFRNNSGKTQITYTLMETKIIIFLTISILKMEIIDLKTQIICIKTILIITIVSSFN